MVNNKGNTIMQYINTEKLADAKVSKYYGKYAHLFDDIINKSYYVTKDDVIKGAIEFVSSLDLHNTKVYVLLDSQKIGSQHWLYYHYHKYIGNHKVITDKDTINEDNCTMLVIDDVIIGGGFVSNVLHNFIVKNQDRSNIRVIIYGYAKNIHVDINSKNITWNPDVTDKGYKYETYNSIDLDYYNSSDPLYREYTNTVQAFTGIDYIAIHSDYKSFNSPCNLVLLNNIKDRPNRDFMLEIVDFYNKLKISN